MALSPYRFNAIDDAEAANTRDCSATELLLPIARAVNHLAGRHWKVIFNQALTDSMMAAPAGTFSPLYRFRQNDNWPLFRQYHHRVTCRDTTPQTTIPTFTGVNTGAVNVPGATAAVTPDWAQHTNYTETNGANTVGDVYVIATNSTTNNLRPLAVAILGRRWVATDPTLVTTDVGTIEPNLWAMGKHITHTDLISLRDAIDRNWKDNRRTFGAFCSVGTGTSAQNLMTTAVTTSPGVNMLDTPSAITAQTTNTPGFFCPIRAAGRLGDTTVRCNVAVYAQVVNAGSGGTGEVRFQALNGGSTTAITGITSTAGWFPNNSGSALELGNITVDLYDKVDVFGRMTAASGGDLLRLWAISIIEDPV